MDLILKTQIYYIPVNQSLLGLSFLGTDPAYGRRGAASLMIEWGIDQSKKDKVPAYLESTLEARTLYHKHGFVDCGSISLELDSLKDGKGPHVYTEVAFLLKPENS